MADRTGLEPAASGVTGRCSNQIELPVRACSVHSGSGISSLAVGCQDRRGPSGHGNCAGPDVFPIIEVEITGTMSTSLAERGSEMLRAMLALGLLASAALAAEVEIGTPDFQNSLPFCGD